MLSLDRTYLEGRLPIWLSLRVSLFNSDGIVCYGLKQTSFCLMMYDTFTLQIDTDNFPQPLFMAISNWGTSPHNADALNGVKRMDQAMIDWQTMNECKCIVGNAMVKDYPKTRVTYYRHFDFIGRIPTPHVETYENSIPVPCDADVTIWIFSFSLA